MSKIKGGLGRGLGSLISAPVAPSLVNKNSISSFTPEPLEVVEGELQIRQVSPSDIHENTQQPREYFAEQELQELAASIKEHGILQPLVVSDLGGGKYELIAGERRLRASRSLGLLKIPVIVRPKEQEQNKLELALIENVQRADLNPVEEAKAYQKLITSFGLRQEDVARKVGKSRPAVANALRLLELDEDILSALAEGALSRSHARTLLAEPDLNRRRILFQEMLKGGMTVREAEAKAGASTKRIQLAKDPNVAAIEAELREKFGTKVSIDLKGNSGKIMIHFYSREDLKELVKTLVDKI